MLTLPQGMKGQFLNLLKEKAIQQAEHSHYIKWLHYYLDFCHKYGFARSHPESLPHFLDKLRQKRQSQAQRRQASVAVTAWYELPRSGQSYLKEPEPEQ